MVGPRAKLGQLVEGVAASGDHVALTKQGKAIALMVGRDE
jgi:antitoxin (DNA-binding transcriptional repressor) of toxin-antitoxin stability system